MFLSVIGKKKPKKKKHSKVRDHLVNYSALRGMIIQPSNVIVYRKCALVALEVKSIIICKL
jgi:hypothetical protein